MKIIWHLSRIDGQNSPLGTIEQARMKLRKEVKCIGADGASLWFTIKARSAIELAAPYDINDGAGAPLETMTKDFGVSLVESSVSSPTFRGSCACSPAF